MIRNTLFIAFCATAAWAQSPTLKGRFVLAEEGANTAALGVLAFDGAGTVTGTEYVQAPGLTQSMAVSGSYTLAADGSGTLTLNTQVATEDGTAPAMLATYDFLPAKGGGFAAIRRDSATASLAEILPASSASSYAGAFLLTDEGESASGQAVAQIGVLNLKADGSLGGRLMVKQNGASEAKAVDGSYNVDGSGIGALRLITPTAADEDGNIGTQTTPYVFAVTAAKEIIALRTDNSLLGLARITAQ